MIKGEEKKINCRGCTGRKSGESDQVNFVFTGEDFSKINKVLILICDSETFCVHMRWIQSYFRFHKKIVLTRESSIQLHDSHLNVFLVAHLHVGS